MMVASFFFSSRRRHTSFDCDWSSDVCSSDLDLRAVQDSLAAANAPRLAYGELQHLRWQVETFGFHLAELEVRQHSAVHEQALAEVRAGGGLSAETEEVLGTLR